MPAGLYSGNFIDYGHYDQCVRIEQFSTIPEVQKIESQHCQLVLYDLTPESKTIFSMGVCAPRSCRPIIVFAIMNAFLTTNVGYGVINPQLECTDGTKPEFKALEWTTTSLFIVLGLLIVSCTIYDYVMKWKESKSCLMFDI